LFTSLQYPFELVNPAISVDNTIMSVSISSNVTNCPQDQPCEITFNIVVDPKTLCYLNGVYNITFDLICNPLYNTTSCPLQGETGLISFQIASENLCGNFTENVDIFGSLNSYLSDYSTLKNAFLFGQTVHWRLDVSSSKITISSVTLTELTSVFNSTSTTLVHNQTFIGGGGINFNQDFSNSTDELRFRYLIDNSNYPVPTDQNMPALITATVAIQYQSAQKRSITSFMKVALNQNKRQISTTKQYSQAFNNQINIQNSVSASQKPTIQPVKSSNSDSYWMWISISIIAAIKVYKKEDSYNKY